MNRAGKRAELLGNTDRKKILEILKLVGLCIVPLIKRNSKIIEALRKFQDPLGVKTAKVQKKGIQEMTFETNLLFDEFVRVCQKTCDLDCTDDPVFQILCDGHLPDVAFFCKKICQSIPTINAHNVIRRSHKLRDLRSHCIQPICRECARSVSTPSSISTLGLDFYKHTSPANMFAEWRYIFQKILDGYIAIMARQKDLEAIVRQVDPRNSTTLRAMMKNKELDRNHELINKLMRELRSPINLDDLFICICCNPPQTAGGRLLNDLHNGVKKNVNCLEGGFFAPVKEEITPKVDETKSNDTDEKRSWEKEAGAGKPEGTTNEPNNNSQGKCSNKELFLKLKNGPKPGQVLAEISSCGTKDGKDVIAKESLKCLEHCFCDDETVMDLLKSAYKTIECGCFELLNDEVVLTKPGRNIVSPEILETVLSLMSGFKTKEKESFISKLNLRMMGSPAKIMQDNLLPNNEDVMTSVNMKATKVTVTITPKDARVSNNSNKRRTAQVVYVSSPYKDNPPPNNSPVVNPIPRTCAESESDDNLFQGPPNYDKSNDYTRVVEVADKSTQTMEYNGDDFTSDNYWLFNFLHNAQEIKILSQSHTFRKTVRVRKIVKKVYEKSIEPIKPNTNTKSV